MVGKIACFLTCGYTEAGVMQSFLRKINGNYEFKQYLNEIYIEKLIIFSKVLICRYSPCLQAFAAFFFTEDVLKCSHFPSCFPIQK